MSDDYCDDYCAHHGDAYAFVYGAEYRCAACLVERVAELERILHRKPSKAEAERDEARAECERLRSLIPPSFDDKCNALRDAVATSKGEE